MTIDGYTIQKDYWIDNEPAPLVRSKKHYNLPEMLENITKVFEAVLSEEVKDDNKS